MTQTEISHEKISAYEAAHYRAGFGPDAFVLRIGQHSPALAFRYAANGTDCALFITAFNPLGEAQGHNENQVAHATLREALISVLTEIIEGEGTDPTGTWKPEKSYLAFGIDTETAHRLGRQFRQDAAVWAGKDAIPQLLLLR